MLIQEMLILWIPKLTFCGPTKFYFFKNDDNTWVRLTKEAKWKAFSKKTIKKTFSGVDEIKRILVIEGNIPDLDESFAAKKLQENYQLSLKWKAFNCKISQLLQNKFMWLREKQQLILTSICENSLG